MDRIAAIFNEWQRRYAADPESFGQVLDAQGRPVVDYGERCAHYFREIDSAIFGGQYPNQPKAAPLPK